MKKNMNSFRRNLSLLRGVLPLVVLLSIALPARSAEFGKWPASSEAWPEVKCSFFPERDIIVLREVVLHATDGRKVMSADLVWADREKKHMLCVDGRFYDVHPVQSASNGYDHYADIDGTRYEFRLKLRAYER